MANVLSIVSYKILPAKLGGQKGIALFNEYFSRRHNLFCVTVKANDPLGAPYKVFNLLSDSPLRYINIFYFGLMKRMIKDFIDFKDQAILIDKKFINYLKKYTIKIGLTDEKIADMMEMNKKAWEKFVINEDHATILK